MYKYFHYDNQIFGLKDSSFTLLLLWTYFRGSCSEVFITKDAQKNFAKF